MEHFVPENVLNFENVEVHNAINAIVTFTEIACVNTPIVYVWGDKL